MAHYVKNISHPAYMCPCVKCDKEFSIYNGPTDLLVHISNKHKLLIRNMEEIADLKGYIMYYRHLFRTKVDETQFTVEIQITDEGEDEAKETYRFLCDPNGKDKKLRLELHYHKKRLAKLQQKKDLSDVLHYRSCFYCKEVMEATNMQWMNHFHQHGFRFGRPEGMVYISEFIDCVAKTMDSLHCLYCKTRFPTFLELIAHMQEKGHRKIMPSDTFYDKYYMINYEEFGKTWRDFEKAANEEESGASAVVRANDTLWDEWYEEQPVKFGCLLCMHECHTWKGLCLHMNIEHGIPLDTYLASFDFYLRVKLVNFLREKARNLECWNCTEKWGSKKMLHDHMKMADHLYLPEPVFWNRENYLTPIDSEDPFLHFLDDHDDDGMVVRMEEGVKVSKAVAPGDGIGKTIEGGKEVKMDAKESKEEIPLLNGFRRNGFRAGHGKFMASGSAMNGVTVGVQQFLTD